MGITVMHKRPGFAPEYQDLFWAWYTADGGLFLTDETPVAGIVEYACSGCHSIAPGDDWIYPTFPR